MKNGRTTVFLVLIGLAAIAATVFFAARYERARTIRPVGRIGEVDGRVEVREQHGKTWRSIGANDSMMPGSIIKIGAGSMAKVVGPMGSIVAGPDSSLQIDALKDGLNINLEVGEIVVKHGSIPGILSITLQSGTLAVKSLAEIVVSKPAGQIFAVIEARSGEATVQPNNGEPTTVTSTNSPFLFGSAKDPAIWVQSPEPEQVFIAKEGFSAVLFSWNANKSSGSANILIRNLETGEMTIHESASNRDDVTLPSGSYSWALNTGGLISASRRFHIKGALPQEVSSSDTKSTVTVRNLASTNPLENTTDQNGIKPQSEKPPVLERPKIKLIEPAEGASIPVEGITEQRVHWSTTGDVDSIDLEILGSSGNPAKQFTLEGDRTRRRLPALPPGRYTVRVRANGSRGDATASSPWAETFFDVVQTEAGQLAPSDVKVSTTKKGSVPYILVEWSKSTAPRYQVTLITDDAPAKVARTTKSQVLLNFPKDPVKEIEVCALDANLQVRGCAPKVEEPKL